ncbi:MAG: type II secretion system F family protein [Candidatus Gracilibacteria bacterium]
MEPQKNTLDNAPAEPISILTIDEEKIEASENAKQKKPSQWKVLELYHRINEKVEGLSAINVKDKVTFFQLLAIMLGAGVPLVRSLYVLSEQMKNIRFRRILSILASKVEGGKTLSSALEDFHGIFTDAQVGMVRAGEATGRLNDILKQISIQVEKSASLTSKIKGAMIYPVVILCIMTGSVFIILGKVVPKLMELFTQANAVLPTSTRILITMSTFVENHYYGLITSAFVAVGLFYIWKRTDSGKYWWHAFLLRLPVLGRLNREVALARFTRTLASLLSSGIPIVKSLEIDADAIGNEVYRRRLYLAAEDVSRGIPLAENLTDSTFLFPEMVVSMIAVGEQTAELHTVTNKIADYYDSEVDQMAANMSKLLEPVLMVVMGVVVGGLILAVMQPIFNLMDVVGNI